MFETAFDTRERELSVNRSVFGAGAPLAAASLVGVALAIWLGGCASTQLVDVWRDESYAGRPLTKVLVIAVSDEERGRRIFEDSFAREFRAHGVEAVPGYSLLSMDAGLEREAISELIEGKGFDGVVISHNAGIDEETVYVPGRTRTEVWGDGDPRRRGYDGYYRRTWETVSDPGYTTKYTTVFIETNIYETAEQKLIWSARSESYNPASTLEIIDALSKEVIASMKQGGLL
jgi:hypothetical protein